MPASEIALMLALLHGRYVLVTGQLGWSRNVTQCHGQGMALGTKLRQSQGRPRRQGKVYEEGGEWKSSQTGFYLDRALTVFSQPRI